MNGSTVCTGIQVFVSTIPAPYIKVKHFISVPYSCYWYIGSRELGSGIWGANVSEANDAVSFSSNDRVQEPIVYSIS